MIHMEFPKKLPWVMQLTIVLPFDKLNFFTSYQLQVNLCQKLLFLHQLIHNTYNNRLFMKIASSEHGENMLSTQIIFVVIFRTIYVHNMFSPCFELSNLMNNLLSYCLLFDARISASEKDLPVSSNLHVKQLIKQHIF